MNDQQQRSVWAVDLFRDFVKSWTPPAARKHDHDDLSAWRAVRVALGLAPRPDMTPKGRLRRALAIVRNRA